MSWFDPNIAFNPTDSSSFDAAAEQRKLALKQALISKMQQQTPEQGKMVSGWYVAPGQKASSMSMLSNLLGSYLQAKHYEGQDQLDKASREAYGYGRDLLDKSNDPNNYVDDAKHNALAYTHKDPSQVGPQLPGDEATAYPVQQPATLTAGSLPPAQAALPAQPGPLQKAMQAASQQQATQSNPTYDQMGNVTGQETTPSPSSSPTAPISGGGGEFRGNGATGSFDAPASQPGPLQKAMQAASQQQTAPKPTAQYDITIPTPRSPVSTQGDQGFNVDTGAQVKYLKNAMRADTNKARDVLERSGERGVGLVKAVDAAALNNKGEFKGEVLKDGDGNSVGYMVIDSKTGQPTVYGMDGKPTQGLPSSGASLKANKDRREEIKVWGEQRKNVVAAREVLDTAGSRIDDLMTATSLAKDLNINNVIGQKWEQAKDMLGQNPKYKALHYIASQGFLDTLASMKGSSSDKDLSTVMKSRPGAGSTVSEWMIWAQDSIPKLQAYKARAELLHSGEVTTARELGVPEYLKMSDSASASSSPTNKPTMDWKR
jgi:hypothetical protein